MSKIMQFQSDNFVWTFLYVKTICKVKSLGGKNG